MTTSIYIVTRADAYLHVIQKKIRAMSINSHIPDLSFLIQALPISKYPNNLIRAFLQFFFIQIQPKSKTFRIICNRIGMAI